MKNIISTLFFSVIIGTNVVQAQPQQGMEAYEVSLLSANGDTVKLSSLKGKVVLLDFWASWCHPCRQANKHLAKLYPKYKDKGFEILGVSLDIDRNEWLKAVRQDKVSWLQVIDQGGWESLTVAKWGLYALPTSYLVDRNGRLIAMDLEGKQLEKALKELIDK